MYFCDNCPYNRQPLIMDRHKNSSEMTVHSLSYWKKKRLAVENCFLIWSGAVSIADLLTCCRSQTKFLQVCSTSNL